MINSVERLRLRSLRSGLALLVIVGSVIGVILTKGASTPAQLPRLPPQLPVTYGLIGASSFSDIGSGSVPFWQAKDGNPPLNLRTTQLALVGGLGQIWVPTSAVREFGHLKTGIPLPIPLTFARLHRGPVEVTLEVLRFNQSSIAKSYYSNPVFSHLRPLDPGISVLHGIGVPHRGRALLINSVGNGGLSEYLFQWRNGLDLVSVSMLGYDSFLVSALRMAELIRG